MSHRKKERPAAARVVDEPAPPTAKQKKPSAEDASSSSSKVVARPVPAAATAVSKKTKKAYWREPAFSTNWDQLTAAEKAGVKVVAAGPTKDDVILATQLVRCKTLFKEKQDIWFPYMTVLLVYPWHTLTEDDAPLVWRLIPLLNYTEETDVDFLIDDDLKELFTAIGPLAVEPLSKFLQDATRDNRDLAAEILAEIAEKHSQYKRVVIGACGRGGQVAVYITKEAWRGLMGRCTDLLMTILRKWKDESDILNGYIVSALCDLGAAEALPLIRRAYEGSAVDEDVAGDWSEVLEALDEPLRSNDPLVTMCKHCERPTLVCRREVEALRAILGEKASVEGAHLFLEGKTVEAMQKLLMAYTYYPWHLDERYALPLLQSMRSLGLLEEALHLSVEFLRYHHFTRDKERALFRLIRAEVYEMLGQTQHALEELKHVQTDLIPEALESVRERIEAFNANKTRAITFDATAAKTSRSLASFRTVTLSSPVAFVLSAPCCNQLRHHAISALTDPHHFAYASSCHTVSVRRTADTGDTVFILAEEPSVVALEGDELATANLYTFQISIYAFKKSSHTPTHRLVGHSSTVLALQMTPTYIVSCSSADVRVWSRETKQLLRNLWGHRGPLASLRVHGDSVITASETVLIEHTLSTGAMRRMFLGHEAAVQTVDFNAHIVISCDAHTTALLHDRQTGTLLKTLSHDGLCAVSSSLIALRSDTFVELLDLEGDVITSTPLPSFVTDLALFDDEKDGGYFTAACLDDLTPRIVRVPFFSKKVLHCHQCKTTEESPTRPTFKACGSCKAATYCSAACQRSHWPTHKLVCTPRTPAASSSSTSSSSTSTVPTTTSSSPAASAALHRIHVHPPIHTSCLASASQAHAALSTSPPSSLVSSPPLTPPRSDSTPESVIPPRGTSTGSYTDPE